MIAEAFSAVAELFLARGLRSLKDVPGLTRVQIDPHWQVTFNPHREELEAIPFGHMAIEYNGWPAGLIAPSGGVIAAGECANEDTFIAAVKAAILAT